MVLLIVFGLIFLALVGAPLFSVFGAASISLFLSMPEGTWASVAIDVFSSKFAESPSLVTIPLFTFAGYMLADAGTPRRLVMLSRAWLGWMPGGMALVCLGASAFFTTFTGGSGVTIVAIGGLLFPALLAERYSEKFSLGLITTGGSLGILFPPSVPLIMYGIIASLAGGGLVLTKVMVAGIIPGVIVVAVLGVYGAYVGIRSGVPRTAFHFKEAWATLWVAKWEIVIPIVLVGGLVTGLFRIHEASALTAVYVLFIEVFVYRDIGIRKDLPRIVVESMIMVGAILAILSAAIGFTGWMVQAQIADALADWMEAMVSSKVVFLLFLNLFLLVVGMLMDVFTAIMVVVPLMIPMANAYGIDPYHMAIIFLLNLEIGYLTPPLGVNLFISSIRFSKSMTYVCQTILPFIGVLIVTLVIVTYVPILSTWLPSKIQVGEESEAFQLPDVSEKAEPGEELPEDTGDDMGDILAAGDGGVDAAEDGAVEDAEAGQEEAGKEADASQDKGKGKGKGEEPAGDKRIEDEWGVEDDEPEGKDDSEKQKAAPPAPKPSDSK